MSTDFRAYNLDCTEIELPENSPIGAMNCLLSVGERSTIHKHHELEIFIFSRGVGEVIIDGISTAVSEGKVVVLAEFSEHVVVNNGVEPLEFAAVWCDSKLSAKDAVELLSNRVSHSLIISTPPTPNGDLHLGHLSGPYLGADIYRRSQEKTGVNSFHLTGRDDNQSYVPKKALDTGLSTEKTAEKYGNAILSTLNKANISIDHFSDPSRSEWHTRMVKSVFNRLLKQGYIYKKETNAYFDPQTGAYLHEAFIRGKCPHCGESCDGNACEQCGRPNDNVDLINPVSGISGKKPVIRKVENYYFRFDRFKGPLLEYALSTSMSAHVRDMCLKMLSEGLPDICVTHYSDWGIDPLDDSEGLKVYVWFEMAAGYIAAAEEISEKLGLGINLFKSIKSEIVHFYGFDNSYYHTLLFPAIYMAFDSDIELPDAHIVNELLNLEGKKFSTSRNHLIWGADMLKVCPADMLRWYLCTVRPENTTGDFSVLDMVEATNTFFFEKLMPTYLKVQKNIVEHYDGRAPSTGSWNSDQIEFKRKIEDLVNNFKNELTCNRFSPRGAVEVLSNLLNEINLSQTSYQYIMGNESAKDMLRTNAALGLWSMKAFLTCSEVIFPSFSREMADLLSIGKLDCYEKIEFIPAGSSVSSRAPNFGERLNVTALDRFAFYQD